MPQDNTPPTNAADEENRAKEIEAQRQRAEKAEMALELREIADSHGVDCKDLDLRSFASKDAGLIAIMERMGKAQAPEPKVPAQPAIITADPIDKTDRAIQDAAVLRLCSDAKDIERNEFCGRSWLELGREFLKVRGIQVPNTRVELANLLLQKRDAANVTSADFTTYVLANAFNKSVMRGYGAVPTTFDMWAVQIDRPDFKTFKGGAITAGTLQETAENVAFPELAKAEDGYSDALSMWGATMSLTMQALVNDDLGEFERNLTRAGGIARHTVEKQVYAELNGGTWTGYTTTTGALGTDGNLGIGVAAFMNRTDGNSEIIGLSPSYLLVPAGLYEDALQKTTQVQGSTERVVNNFLTPVVSPFLTTDGTPANSTYYLAANPTLADTLVVSWLEGVRAPMMMEYDAGAVAARKWKLMLPFQTTLPAGRVGIHQCTQS